MVICKFLLVNPATNVAGDREGAFSMASSVKTWLRAKQQTTEAISTDRIWLVDRANEPNEAKSEYAMPVNLPIQICRKS